MSIIQNILTSVVEDKKKQKAPSEKAVASTPTPAETAFEARKYWTFLQSSPLEKVLITYIIEGIKSSGEYSQLSLLPEENDLKYNRLAAGIQYAIKMLPSYKKNKPLEVQNTTDQLIAQLKNLTITKDLKELTQIRLSVQNSPLEKVLNTYILDGIKRNADYTQFSLLRNEKTRKYNRIATSLDTGIRYAIEMLPYYKENKSLEIQNNTDELIDHLKKLTFTKDPKWIKRARLSVAKLSFVYSAWYYRMGMAEAIKKSPRFKASTRTEAMLDRSRVVIAGILNRDNKPNPDPENYLASLFFDLIPRNIQAELAASKEPDYLGINQFLKRLWEEDRDIQELEKEEGKKYARRWQRGPSFSGGNLSDYEIEDEDDDDDEGIEESNKIKTYLLQVLKEAREDSLSLEFDADFALSESEKNIERALIKFLFFTGCGSMNFPEGEKFVTSRFYTNEAEKHVTSKKIKDVLGHSTSMENKYEGDDEGDEMTVDITQGASKLAFSEKVEAPLFKGFDLFSELDTYVFAAIFVNFLHRYITPNQLDVLTIPRISGTEPHQASLITWLSEEPNSKYRKKMTGLATSEGELYKFNIAIPDFFNIFTPYLENPHESSLLSEEQVLSILEANKKTILTNLYSFGKKYDIEELSKQKAEPTTEVQTQQKEEKRDFLSVLNKEASTNRQMYNIQDPGAIHRVVEALQTATTETVANKYIKLAEVLYTACTDNGIKLLASICRMMKSIKEYEDSEGFSKVHQIRTEILSTTNPNKQKGLAHKNVAGRATDLIKFNIELPESKYPEAETLFFADPTLLEAILKRLKQINLEKNEEILSRFDKRSNPEAILNALIYKIDFILRLKKAPSIITEGIELEIPKAQDTNEEILTRFIIESLIVIDRLTTYGRKLIKFLRNLARERNRIAIFFNPETISRTSDMFGIRGRLNIPLDDPSGQGMSRREIEILTDSFIYNIEKNNSIVFKPIIDDAELVKIRKFCAILKKFIQSDLMFKARLKNDLAKQEELDDFYSVVTKLEEAIAKQLQISDEKARTPIDLTAVRYYLKLYSDDIRERHGEFKKEQTRKNGPKNPMLVQLDRLVSSSYFGPAIGIYPGYIDSEQEKASEDKEASERQKLLSKWE